MKRLISLLAILTVLSVSAIAQETVIDGFEVVPGTGGWLTGFGSATSGQNKNIADGGTLTVSASHVTEGAGSGLFSLNVLQSGLDTVETANWPGTAPEWGARWYTSSGSALGTFPLGDTYRVDVFNDTPDVWQFALLLRDQSNAGDLIRGPWVNLPAGASTTYEFVPETDAVIWIGTGNGVVDGSVCINSMMFTRDDQPTNAANNFYIDNLRREGAQTDTEAPAAPLLKSVKLKPGTTDQVIVSWFANTDSDLDGYRLYRSRSINIAANLLTFETSPILDENTLDSNATEATVTIDAGSTVTLFSLTAVDNATPNKNESIPGQPLAVKLTGTTDAPEVLCVMDLQRYQPGELNFGAQGYNRMIMYSAHALNALDEPFFSATAEGVADGAVSLLPSNYKMVVWSTGRDGNSTNSPVLPDVADELQTFLTLGGHLYISGELLVNGLSANTAGGPAIMALMGVGASATAGSDAIDILPGSLFAGVTADLVTDNQFEYAAFASTTNHVITAAGAGAAELQFDTTTNLCGVSLEDDTRRVVTTSFAFESLRQQAAAASADSRTQVMEAILNFMGAAPGPLSSADAVWHIYE